jgi:hypothetical protein
VQYVGQGRLFIDLVICRLRFLGRIDPNNQTSRPIWTNATMQPPVPRKRVIPALRNVPIRFTGDAADMKDLTPAQCVLIKY